MVTVCVTLIIIQCQVTVVVVVIIYSLVRVIFIVVWFLLFISAPASARLLRMPDIAFPTMTLILSICAHVDDEGFFRTAAADSKFDQGLLVRQFFDEKQGFCKSDSSWKPTRSRWRTKYADGMNTIKERKPTCMMKLRGSRESQSNLRQKELLDEGEGTWTHADDRWTVDLCHSKFRKPVWRKATVFKTAFPGSPCKENEKEK